MHLSPISRMRPAKAANIEVVLDIINQIIGTIRALESLLGLDLAAWLGKNQQVG